MKSTLQSKVGGKVSEHFKQTFKRPWIQGSKYKSQVTLTIVYGKEKKAEKSREARLIENKMRMSIKTEILQ